MKKPQFQSLQFNSKAEFERWLDKTQSKVIDFLDLGGDLLRMHIHESGEVLHCNAHANIYNGKFVDMEKLKPGYGIVILLDDEWTEMGKLIIDTITEK